MTSATIPPAILELADRLSGWPVVRRVILFGSRARGDHAPRSDVDLAVDTPGADVRTWDAICSAVEDADTLLRIDVVRLDEASPAFRDRILSEGTVLFERSLRT